MHDPSHTDANTPRTVDGRRRWLEVCVEDIAGLEAAIAGGADRVELCAALTVGGLSPAPGLIAAAATAAVDVHMLVRPHAGSFRYSAHAADAMAADITAAIQAGLAGVVIGAALGDGALDTAMLGRLIDHARRDRPVAVTLHRAFDLCRDLPAALEEAIALGFDRVLTSGGTPRAADGIATLATLHRQAAGRITIMAGSGVSAESVAAILGTGIADIHASCASEQPAGDTSERRFGFCPAVQRHTDVARVRALRAAIDR